MAHHSIGNIGGPPERLCVAVEDAVAVDGRAATRGRRATRSCHRGGRGTRKLAHEGIAEPCELEYTGGYS